MRYTTVDREGNIRVFEIGKLDVFTPRTGLAYIYGMDSDAVEITSQFTKKELNEMLGRDTKPPEVNKRSFRA